MASRAGQLLIASARLGDPNFAHTVVLLVQDDDEHGSLGVVLNRPLQATVKDAFEQELHLACAIDSPLYKGGPCEQLLTVIHTVPEQDSGGDIEVLKGVFFTSRRESIESVILHAGDQEAGEDERRHKFFVGYAGWSAGQLSAEIEAGGWLLMPAKQEHIFDASAEEQWNKLITEVTLGKWVDVDRLPDDPTVN
jgi:putative transcriptional regulator